MILAFTFWSLSFLIAPQSAPTTHPADNTAADMILERSIAARGGREAFAALSHRYFEGKSITNDGRENSDRGLVGRRGGYWYEGSSEQDGLLRSGSDGSTFWAIDGEHHEIYEGEQLDYKQAEAAFDVFVDYEQYFPLRRLMGSAIVNGSECDVIRLTSKSGRVEDWYIDRETSLVLRVWRQWLVGSRRVQVNCDYFDYRTVDGVKVAHAIVHRSVMPGGLMEMRTEYSVISYTRNKPGEREFALPEEIEQLRSQRAQSQPASSRPSPPRALTR